MRRPYQILLPLFSLFLVRVDLTDLAPLVYEVEVIKVYDGDTLLVKRGALRIKVRLSKIDAPEKTQPFVSGRKGAGVLAHECLVRLLPSKPQLVVEGVDIYGRILGDVGGMSSELIKSGCVGLYPHAKFENQQQKYKFLREFYKAKRLKKGLWAFGGIEQPKAWRKKNKHVFRRRT